MTKQVDLTEIRLGRIYTMLITCVAYLLAASAYITVLEEASVYEV